MLSAANGSIDPTMSKFAYHEHAYCAYRGGPVATQSYLRARSTLNQSTGCLIWTGAVSKIGFPQAWFPLAGATEVAVRVHRVALLAFTGSLPEGATIGQRCGERRCIAPEHLREISPSERVLTNRAQRPLSERIWSKVDKGDGSGCWLWTGPKNNHGYGVLRLVRVPGAKRRGEFAHRLAWEITHGAPSALCVLHRCDTPACVRPEHLFEGTKRDNSRDMVAKGRQKHGPCIGNAGLGNSSAKVTPDMAREMRRQRMAGIPLRDIEERFGVASPTLHAVLSGRHWTVRGAEPLTGTRSQKKTWGNPQGRRRERGAA